MIIDWAINFVTTSKIKSDKHFVNNVYMFILDF